MSKKNKYSTAGAIEMLDVLVDPFTPEGVEKEPITVSIVEKHTDLAPAYGTVAFAPFVNLRKEPNHKGDVIDIIPSGTIVKLKNLIDIFYEIELKDGRSGYMSSKFLIV